MDRHAELVHLAQAERHIAVAERNVCEQRLEMLKLRQQGMDDKLAERTMKAFEASLATLQEHREMIILTIEQIDDGLL